MKWVQVQLLWVQLRLLWPDWPHVPHILCFYLGGNCGESREGDGEREPTGVVEGVAGLYIDGTGHVVSFDLSLVQYWRILSWRYHCRAALRPLGFTISGNSVTEGVHKGSFRISYWTSTPLLTSLHSTFPMVDFWKVKYWYFLMPEIFFRCSAKYEHQSYVGICTTPSSHPTTSTSLHTADFFTTSAISLSVSTWVRRNCCLSRPKQESGVNFVWPTIMKESVMESLKPVITLQQRYWGQW